MKASERTNAFETTAHLTKIKQFIANGWDHGTKWGMSRELLLRNNPRVRFELIAEARN